MSHCGVYIMTNESHSALYVGMSADLPMRVSSHKEGNIEGFTKRYRCYKLVYYEGTDEIEQAYAREKQLKGWTRIKKMGLINYTNPEWEDLFEKLITDCS